MIISQLPFHEVLKDVSGGNIKIPKSQYKKDGRLPIIDQGKPYIGGYTDDLDCKFSKSTLPVIIFGDHTKIVKYVDHSFAMGADGVKVLKPLCDKYDGKYLYHFLRQVRITEGGYDRHFKYLKRTTIPIPSLPEQKRIADILDKADALREKRKESIEKLDKLLQSVFLDMFGDPVNNPKGWNTERLDKIGEIVTGNTPPRKRADYYGDAIEWIKSDNLNTPEYLVSPAVEKLSESGKAVGRIVPSGSILITCIAGSPSCIGNLGYTDRAVAFNQQINAVVPANDKSPFYLYSLLKYSKKLIQQASTNGMKGLVSKGNLSKIRLINPPEKLRVDFNHIFQAIISTQSAQRKSLFFAENLFNSLQQRAFRGEL